MTKIVRGITSGINRLTWISEILSEIALLGLLILVFHEVVVRYALRTPGQFQFLDQPDPFFRGNK